MTNLTTLQQNEKNLTAAYVLNFLGVVAGGTVAAVSLATMSPIGFFAGIAAAMFCLDGIKPNS
ncbi:MAG: hypothetical protein NC301_00970 [Bacteroides sp.]|nr:hypothetical protein [Bacteroides sp.]MCM1445433.1 hypothetical protein [Prevotella sp.]